jgi:tetratricopeptide (TPR) repeat protein
VVQYAAACQHLESLLPIFREGNPALLAETLQILGVDYVQLERDPDAIAVWSELLTLQTEPDLHFWRDLGLAYSRVGEAAHAIVHLERYHQENGLIDREVAQALGIAYFHQGDYVQAIAYLERYGEEVSDCPPQIARYLSEAYYFQHDYLAAWPYFPRGAQLLSPLDVPDYWLHWGHCAYELPDYAQAVQHLQTALGIGHPPSIEPVVYFRLGQAYLALKQYADAIAPLERYLALGHDTAEPRAQLASAQLALGIAGYHQGDLPSAAAHLQAYLTQEAKTAKADALFYLGDIYAQMEKPQETVQYLQQYLTITGRIAAPPAQLQTTLFDLGVAYCRLADYRHGLDYLQQYFASMQAATEQEATEEEATEEANTHYHTALFWAGLAHQRCGNYTDAIARLTERQSRQPHRSHPDDPTLLHLGEVHLLLGHYEQATACLTEYLEAAQQSHDALAKAKAMARLGRTFAERGDAQKALSTCQKALRLVRALEEREEEGQLLDTLGLIYRDLEDLDRAMSLHQQAWNIARSMNHPAAIAIALGHLGMTYCALGNYTQAVKHLEQSLQVAQQLGEEYTIGTILCGLGESLTSLGDYPKAQGYFERAVDLARKLEVQPLEAEIQYQYARFQERLGNLDLARHHCEEAIEFAIAGQYARLGVYWQLRDQLQPSLWQRFWRKIQHLLPVRLSRARMT